ncbi:MAG: hypothetical protein AUJ49_05090 [Desulfovibrionaceae bacterium CG1_02_65_16]|nr:MAG: hypothetical protein AUJ49_05090 [Desulfovibrionaceae bacterium CG1_02_65_16]
MQKIAAYLLERRDDMEWPEARATEANRLKTQVESWLRSKGASSIGSTGSYQPPDGSAGTFKIQEAADGERTLWALDLQEDTTGGRRFLASLSIIAGRDTVSVYITLETGWMTTQVMPVSLDPRCPKIVRDLIRLPGRWFHGASLLNEAKSITGFDAGETLVHEIQYADRSVPILAISNRYGELALPDLDRTLGHDLVGLANVCILDEDASWALTDALGRDWCCYHGAVRLYWPRFALSQDRFQHPLWTAERLRSREGDLEETRELFRRQLRGLLFRASALSVTRPREIDEIRDAHNRRGFTELRQQATSLAAFEALADSYATENDQLCQELTLARGQIEGLQEQVRTLEGDKLALRAHLTAKGSAEDVKAEGEIAPGGDECEVESTEPTSGETRFYKKVHAAPTHDIMEHVNDCGHNRWQPSSKGDKARKGIAKLEGRSDWQSLHHCGTCTGGGMWKVRW